MVKTAPIELANISTVGSANGTYQLSVLLPGQGMQAKQGYKESCAVIHLSALSGTSPTITFNVYEIVDNAAILVGTTGAMSSADDRVIDSGGGQVSTGGTFLSSSGATLRLFGKGTDMKVVASTTGTLGTVAYTVNAILYDG